MSDHGSTLPGQEHAAADTDQEVSKKCLDITERFHVRRISKVAAILELQRAIPGHDGTESEHTAFITALGSYIQILNSFKRLRANAVASEGGARFEDGAEAENGRSEGEDIPRSPRSSAPSLAPRSHKRRRSSSSDSDDSGGGHRKCRINIAELPWVAYEALGVFAPLPPSLDKMQSILENISQDIKYAKASLLLTPHLPQFPDSEWTNVLHGRAVDIDHVLAAMYSISRNDRRTE